MHIMPQATMPHVRLATKCLFIQNIQPRRKRERQIVIQRRLIDIARAIIINVAKATHANG